jgi:23S rRNA maturation mini-RNase III
MISRFFKLFRQSAESRKRIIKAGYKKRFSASKNNTRLYDIRRTECLYMSNATLSREIEELRRCINREAKANTLKQEAWHEWQREQQAKLMSYCLDLLFTRAEKRIERKIRRCKK